MTVVFAALYFLLRLPSFAGAAFTAGSSLVLCQRRRNCCGHASLFVTAAVGSDDESRDAITITDVTTTRRHSLGLLRGVDTTVDNFYADEIDMSKEGLAWLNQPGRMWEAAKEDAAEKGVPVEEYIEVVKTNIQKFISSKIIYDRQELLMYLNMAFDVNGSLTLLLGGKNVGKSTVLKRLAKDKNSEKKLLVLYVDARLSPGHLNVGLANGVGQLAADGQLFREGETEDWVAVMRSYGKSHGEKAVDFAVAKFDPDGEKNGKKSYLREILEIIVNSLLEKNSGDDAEVSKSLLENFIGIAKNQIRFPVLVIDEANVVLGIENNGKPDSRTKDLLINFATYTKQDGRMNVILASSEHGYPYRLEPEGFDLRNMNRPIFAGEVPPNEMWKLLVNAKYEEGTSKGKTIIGMGPHLAELCLAAYGGHLMIVQQAIQDLSVGKDTVVASVFLPNLRKNIIRCLRTNNAKSRPLLKAMAKYGFATVETPDNPAAKLISKENIGGVITQNAVCIGISEAKWKGATDTDALIPSSQCVRLRIAQVLLTRPTRWGNFLALFKVWKWSKGKKSETETP